MSCRKCKLSTSIGGDYELSCVKKMVGNVGGCELGSCKSGIACKLCGCKLGVASKSDGGKSGVI